MADRTPYAVVGGEPLSPSDARALTDEVKADAATLWSKLLTLYEGGAHTALGYSSWGAYYEAEFGQDKSRGYRLLDAARVVSSLPHSPMGEWPNERQARELSAVPEPERASVWQEANERAATEDRPVTAADVKASRMAVHYSSVTDEWATPQGFFDEVNRTFGFELDVCALPESAKCARYFGPQDDGLAQPWTGTCWMNPPYGTEIGAWVKKAHDSALDGATVVCLLPARVDTGWWWDYCRFGEIRFIRGRLKFGNADTSAPFPSALVVFGPGVTPRVVWWER